MGDEVHCLSTTLSYSLRANSHFFFEGFIHLLIFDKHHSPTYISNPFYSSAFNKSTNVRVLKLFYRICQQKKTILPENIKKPKGNTN
jgi:hypothetical protein